MDSPTRTVAQSMKASHRKHQACTLRKTSARYELPGPRRGGISGVGLLLAAIVMAFAGAEAAHAEVKYRMTVLGALGGNESWASGLNNLGQVVGGAQTESGEYHAFLYSDGVMTDLGATWGVSCAAQDINDAGQIVGNWSTPVPERRGFLYENGVMTDLGTLGGTECQVSDINELGQIVGESTTASGQKHAFLYEQGQMVDLLPNLGNSRAESINDNGLVVGGVYVEGHLQAIVLDGETLSYLGTLGGDDSLATTINEDGVIGGWSTMAPNDMEYQYRAFVYQDGTMEALLPVGDWRSYVSDINSNGVMVGYSYEGEPHAIVSWNGEMIDLNDLVEPYGDWYLDTAYAINDRGQILCNGYSVIEQTRQGILLTPVPEPGVLACLFVMGGWAIGRKH